MKLGLLSDTHDRADALAAALELLRPHHIDFYIHCGDVGDPPMLDLLAGLPAAFVFGNNDFDRASLRRYAQDIGIQCMGAHGILELAGKQIAVMHGDDTRLKRQLLEVGNLDYLFQGHTHIPLDEQIGRTRVINPGALHRAPIKTVATLDLTTAELRFLKVVVP